MAKPWFDPQTQMLMLDQYVEEMPSYKKIIADQYISDEELDQHAHRVVKLLQQLDERLPEDLKALATDALCELAVLYALQRQRGEQFD